jgi:hypothetical protein
MARQKMPHQLAHLGEEISGLYAACGYSVPKAITLCALTACKITSSVRSFAPSFVFSHWMRYACNRCNCVQTTTECGTHATAATVCKQQLDAVRMQPLQLCANNN